MEGPEITRHDFVLLVERLLEVMRSGETMDAADAVSTVRAWNTIVEEHLDTRLFAEFSKMFTSIYLERVLAILGAELTKGMAYYSKTHDIYIGGPRHAPSRFHWL